jgi:hypothetical protein
MKYRLLGGTSSTYGISQCMYLIVFVALSIICDSYQILRTPLLNHDMVTLLPKVSVSDYPSLKRVHVAPNEAVRPGVSSIVYMPSLIHKMKGMGGSDIYDDEHFCSVLCDAGFTVHCIDFHRSIKSIKSEKIPVYIQIANVLKDSLQFATDKERSSTSNGVVLVANELSSIAALRFLLPRSDNKERQNVDKVFHDFSLRATVLVNPPLNNLVSLRQTSFDRDILLDSYARDLGLSSSLEKRYHPATIAASVAECAALEEAVFMNSRHSGHVSTPAPVPTPAPAAAVVSVLEPPEFYSPISGTEDADIVASIPGVWDPDCMFGPGLLPSVGVRVRVGVGVRGRPVAPTEGAPTTAARVASPHSASASASILRSVVASPGAYVTELEPAGMVTDRLFAVMNTESSQGAGHGDSFVGLKNSTGVECSWNDYSEEVGRHIFLASFIQSCAAVVSQ